MRKHQVLLGVGSNIAREYHTQEAYRRLHQDFTVLRVSPVYDCPAMGFVGAPFYNWVLCLETAQSLSEIVQYTKQLEADYGRKDWHKTQGSRTMDIDILCFDQWVCSAPLVLPRAEILHRAFVLKPLADIVPDQVHPVAGQTYLQLWQQFDQAAQPIQPVAFTWSALPA